MPSTELRNVAEAVANAGNIPLTRSEKNKPMRTPEQVDEIAMKIWEQIKDVPTRFRLDRSSSSSPHSQLEPQFCQENVLKALNYRGYAIIENYVSDEALRQMRTELTCALDSTPVKGRNFFEGYHTSRLYAVFQKVRCMDQPATDPFILECVEQILNTPNQQLSSPVGIRIGPGEQAQILHRDDGKYPLPRPFSEVVMNTMWSIDGFTEANGATRLVEGSHLFDYFLSQEEISSFMSDIQREEASEKRRISSQLLTQAVMPGGSTMLYRGSIHHGGGQNSTEHPRLGIILEFIPGWLRQQENHTLAVDKEIVKQLPEKLQELLGYNIEPPFVGMVDGRHPKKVLSRL